MVNSNSPGFQADPQQAALIMRIYQDGQRSAQEVGKNLKDPIFAQVFVDLATGLAEAMRRRGDEVESKQSLNLLYRAIDQVGPRSLLQYGSLSPKAFCNMAVLAPKP